MEEFRIDPTIAYDVVELPSKGIHYQNKKKSLRVAYLTAADENILSSPNLVATNTVVDELLKRKILDKDINIDDIVDGLIKIAESNEQHDDAWELGTGKNYSINDVANMFIERFSCVKVYMTEQKGNYRETIRVNNDAIDRLGWSPSDKLENHVKNL